jgi:hypothetical protein
MSNVKHFGASLIELVAVACLICMRTTNAQINNFRELEMQQASLKFSYSSVQFIYQMVIRTSTS